MPPYCSKRFETLLFSAARQQLKQQDKISAQKNLQTQATVAGNSSL